MNISIKIKSPLLRAYLPMLFLQTNGTYRLSQRSLTGMIMMSLIKVKPCECGELFLTKDESLVQFEVPAHYFRCDMSDKCLYLSPKSMSIINRVLKREFDMCFLEHWSSYVSSGLTISQAVESFIIDNNLDGYFLGDIGTLSKRIIRYRLDSLRRLRTRMRRSVYYKKHLKSLKKKH